ncbi:Sterol reductase/lamin B receptor [Ceraceosorus bombacis]|uniref:Delta(14)-sterol reductase ERG24 n=1 Tax=Ceraceosorus bombacis TaxID=401625 RepID=A0A0P1BM27_9BASI|nr:Sterol reductase/lamin B receptor [Ceraceosorus bombacis]
MVQTRGQSRTPSKKGGKVALNGSPALDPDTPSPAPRTSSRAALQKHGQDVLAPKSHEYEFGGPIGALGVTLAVPFFSYAMFFFCNENVGCSVTPKHLDLIWKQFGVGLKESFLDVQGWAIYFAWYAFVVLCWAVLPGKWEIGTELRTGERLSYKINAFATLVASFVGAVAIISYKGPQGFTFLYDHWPALVSASIANSIGQAVYVYAASYRTGRLLAKGGNTGNFLYDWFIGRELNPRIGIFDIKTFNELRPGLILWALLDISCACKQWVKLGGRITDSMVLVVAFHGWYVIDALFNETAILTQMDITTDGFGFMLSVGDLTWVPFIYSLQARYLAFVPVDLGYAATAGILFVNGLGYWIFRDSNGEKNDFRNGTNPKNLKYMETKTGRKLLTSGWWGRSRHPNYMGDLIMSLAWSLPTAFNTPIPYMYPVYFLVLLVHRQRRDDAACKEKYGADWDKYCKIVPWRIFPYIY